MGRGVWEGSRKSSLVFLQLTALSQGSLGTSFQSLTSQQQLTLTLTPSTGSLPSHLDRPTRLRNCESSSFVCHGQGCSLTVDVDRVQLPKDIMYVLFPSSRLLPFFFLALGSADSPTRRRRRRRLFLLDLIALPHYLTISLRPLSSPPPSTSISSPPNPERAQAVHLAPNLDRFYFLRRDQRRTILYARIRAL